MISLRNLQVLELTSKHLPQNGSLRLQYVCLCAHCFLLLLSLRRDHSVSCAGFSRAQSQYPARRFHVPNLGACLMLFSASRAALVVVFFFSLYS